MPNLSSSLRAFLHRLFLTPPAVTQLKTMSLAACGFDSRRVRFVSVVIELLLNSLRRCEGGKKVEKHTEGRGWRLFCLGGG